MSEQLSSGTTFWRKVLYGLLIALGILTGLNLLFGGGDSAPDSTPPGVSTPPFG